MNWTGFGLILAALVVYGVLHSIAASLAAKQIAVTTLGPAAARWYRLGFSLYALVTFLPVLVLFAWLPDQTLYQVTFPAALLLLAVQAAGLGLFAWTLVVTDVWSFLGMRQVTAGDRQVEFLTVRGPYAWVRHPMYTASLMILWFTPWMTFNLLALNLGITAYFVIGGIFEERKLLRQFGPAYAAYRERTPMLFPWPRPRKSSTS
jgi:methanethiol S-methyltransferase